jgi:hypothetical protein
MLGICKYRGHLWSHHVVKTKLQKDQLVTAYYGHGIITGFEKVIKSLIGAILVEELNR